MSLGVWLVVLGSVYTAFDILQRLFYSCDQSSKHLCLACGMTRDVFFKRRAGDSKLKGFVGMTEILNTTSVGVLQEQCLKRNLKVRDGIARCGAVQSYVYYVHNG